MYWILKDKLGTASLPELEAVKKLKDVEVVLVKDLKDGKQKSKGQFESKVKKVEWIVLKKKKKAVIICVGGMSRSNAVALAYLVKNEMDFDEAFNLIRKKVPIAQINMDLIDYVKKKFCEDEFYEDEERMNRCVETDLGKGKKLVRVKCDWCNVIYFDVLKKGKKKKALSLCDKCKKKQ